MALSSPRIPAVLLTSALLSPLDLARLDPGPVYAASFGDTSGHWAANYITALADRGVVNGFPDGSFRPEQPVTRAEFAALLSQALQLGVTGGATQRFSDVPPQFWAAGSINAVSNQTLVAGFPDGTFRPQEWVTRTQTWVVLANTLRGRTIPASLGSNTLSQYRDGMQIPTWAVSQVSEASQARLIINYPDPSLLEPNRPATRGEVAAFVYQTLAQLTQPTPAAALPTPPMQLQVVALQAGSVLRATLPIGQKLYLDPRETRPMPLTVFTPILDAGGTVLIPAGSRIDGRFEPSPGGTRYVAESVIANQRVLVLSAQSDIIPDVKDPRQTGTQQVLEDGFVGAAAGAILGALTGDKVVATEEVLAGGAAGAVIGNMTAPQVVVLDPQQGIGLRLTQDLRVNP